MCCFMFHTSRVSVDHSIACATHPPPINHSSLSHCFHQFLQCSLSLHSPISTVYIFICQNYNRKSFSPHSSWIIVTVLYNIYNIIGTLIVACLTDSSSISITYFPFNSPHLFFCFKITHLMIKILNFMSKNIKRSNCYVCSLLLINSFIYFGWNLWTDKQMMWCVMLMNEWMMIVLSLLIKMN